MLLWILPASLQFRIRVFHALWMVFPVPFCYQRSCLMQSEPHGARTMVWALPRSLAATYGIILIFSSSGYLDVSVHRVPCLKLCIYLRSTGVFPAGFPHSDICGSMCICHSPQLFAAYHVFLRLSVPRHPPCALSCLTFVVPHSHAAWFSRCIPLHGDSWEADLFICPAREQMVRCFRIFCLLLSQ